MSDGISLFTTLLVCCRMTSWPGCVHPDFGGMYPPVRLANSVSWLRMTVPRGGLSFLLDDDVIYIQTCIRYALLIIYADEVHLIFISLSVTVIGP